MDDAEDEGAAGGGHPPISLEVEDWRVEEERAYVDRALAIVEEHDHAADQVDWDEVREAVARQLGSSPSRNGSYLAINGALTRLGTSNTRLIPPATARQRLPERSGELPAVERDGDVLTVELPPVTLNTDTALDYVASAFTSIRASSDPPCGWVVDLRGYVGGAASYPLAVVGPVLAGQEAFSYVRRDGTVTDAHTFAADGSLLIDGRPPGEVIADDWTDDDETALPGGAARAMQSHAEVGPLPTPTPDLPVAVLTSQQTRGGGEAVVVAFRGRAETRSFGRGTYGTPTGGEAHDLEDGAVLVVADSRMTDRDGNSYGSSIPPDVQTSEPETDAEAWLAERGCTAGG